MTAEKIPTRYAPAERAPSTEIDAQSHLFADTLLLRQFLDAVPTGCVVLNEQRQIVFTNQAMVDFVQKKTKDEIYGQRPGEVLNCIHAFETEGSCGTTEFCVTCGAVQAILAGLQGKEAVKECRIVQQNGDALDLRVWATPVSLKGQKFTFFAITDISHEKRRRTLERIFFHDIMNSVGALYGISDLLLKARHEEAVQLTQILHHRSKVLIDEIAAHRQLLAAENNELSVRPIRVNSLVLLHDILQAYQNHEIATDRTIRIAPDAPDIWFTSDEVLLQRVLGNMVKNALEATPPGGVVTMGCTLLKDEIEFWVHNPAVMPRHVQLQIFQRSFSTKGEGRGLGTYSIKLLTERYLQGSVSFISTEEYGTIFRVRYPLFLATNAARHTHPADTLTPNRDGHKQP